MSRRTTLAACAVALFAAALPASAQVKIQVDAATVGAPLPRAVLRGFNFGNWMAVADHEAALAEVPAGALRFPGGNIGDDQNMDEATLDTFASLLKLVRGQPELEQARERVERGLVDVLLVADVAAGEPQRAGGDLGQCGLVVGHRHPVAEVEAAQHGARQRGADLGRGHRHAHLRAGRHRGHEAGCSQGEEDRLHASNPPLAITRWNQWKLSFGVRTWVAKSTCTRPKRLP